MIVNSKGRWYQLSGNTYLKDGWYKIGGSWYCFDSEGYVFTNQWKQRERFWYYLDSYGRSLHRDTTINGKKYSFNSTYGYLESNGWEYLNGNWYYFRSEPWGSMVVIGWKQISGKWYYFDQTGIMHTGWHMSDKALEAFINLSVDICKRNGIPMLKWRNDKKLIGQVDKQNVTVHRWFKKKACPGNYCMDKLPWIVQQVNLRLGAANPSQTSAYTIGGVDYRPVFDPVYYNTRYPDLNAVFHGNAEHLWSHFVNFGRKEGRRASANFDPVVYRFNNPDLNSAFGDDWPKYYEHYLTFGMAEGRVGT